LSTRHNPNNFHAITVTETTVIPLGAAQSHSIVFHEQRGGGQSQLCYQLGNRSRCGNLTLLPV
ncbi:MAG: hypothetical protein ORN83_13190, partial [Chthoniobacteraceae bacterium]|nr:hypothetical protein [Chthoniobacteraceae bacterium]